MIPKLAYRPQYQHKPAFKGTPEEIEKRARKVDMQSPGSMQDFVNSIRKETPETLEKTAKKLKGLEVEGLVSKMITALRAKK